MFIWCLWIQTKFHIWILVCSLLVCGVYIPMGFIIVKTCVTWIFHLCPIKLESHKRWAFLTLGPPFTIFIIIIFFFIVTLLKCKFIFSVFIFGLMQKLENWHVVHFVIGWKFNVLHIVRSHKVCNLTPHMQLDVSFLGYVKDSYWFWNGQVLFLFIFQMVP
jgi:hypothetical protein